MIALDIATGVLFAVGAFFLISGSVGLLRFPDFYTRTHAVSVTDPVGAVLILLGLLLQVDGWDVAIRLLIIMAFMALTSPTATHILAHAARRDGVAVWRAGDARR